VRSLWLTLKYSLALLGTWLLFMELGRRLDPAYWSHILTPR